MKPETSAKLFVVGLLCLFFAGFVLRAALKLFAAAVHSLFGIAVLIAIGLWVLVKTRREPSRRS